MIIIEHTLETSATPAQIWQIWQDVENWNSWDHDLESSHLDGTFTAGTTGMLNFKDGTQLKTVLIQVRPLKMFVQEAKLFLAKAVMTHSLDQVDGKTYVTIKTEIRGPLALFYSWFIGDSIRKKVPHEMREMLKKVTSIS